MSSKQNPVWVWLLPLGVLIALIALELSSLVSLATIVREWVRGDLGRFVPRPDFADNAELFFVAAAGIGIVVQFAQGKVSKAGFVTLGAVLFAIFVSWRAEIDARVFLDAAYPSLVFVVLYLLGRSVYASQLSERRETLRRAFAPRVSAQTASAIARRPELLGLPGKTRNLTYLVCRVCGFSQLTETKGMDAGAFAVFSQRIMTPLAQSILEKGGMIDHVAPGKLSAFFNAPLDDIEHVSRACECALDMIEQLKSINVALEKEPHVGGAPITQVELGIGIDTGPCVVGNFGTEEQPQYSVAGRAVQHAEEIEALSEKYGPAIIVGEGLHAAAEGRFALLELDLLNASPIENAVPDEKPIPIFALLGDSIVRSSPKFRALQTFHDHIFPTYRARQWKKTRALIEQCRALSSPSPVLYELYLARIVYYENNPPPENWNGAFRLPQN